MCTGPEVGGECWSSGAFMLIKCIQILSALNSRKKSQKE